MAAASRLPEIVEFDGLRVRVFPVAYATEFAHLPQSERRSIPAIVRRLLKGAAEHASGEATCSVCGAPAPLEGRLLVAVEIAGDSEQNLGCICGVCFGLTVPVDARAT